MNKARSIVELEQPMGIRHMQLAGVYITEHASLIEGASLEQVFVRYQLGQDTAGEFFVLDSAKQSGGHAEYSICGEELEEFRMTGAIQRFLDEVNNFIINRKLLPIKIALNTK